MLYPKWRQRYSNEDFDRISALTNAMTENDRKAGRDAPDYGYSKKNWDAAETIVKAAQE